MLHTRGWIRAGFWVLLGLGLFGCGAAPQVTVTPDYQEHALEGKRVVVVPLAVSDDLNDRRTGISLSAGTRRLASASACHKIAEAWSQGMLLCPSESGGSGGTLAEIERLFALDQPIPESLWRDIRDNSRAEYALLFRPEGVSSSQEVEQGTRSSGGVVVIGSTPAFATSALVSALLISNSVHRVTVNDTEVAYTLSASLVDVRTGKVLKVGVHSGSHSRTVERNLGYAEAPPAIPLLEEIMADLGTKVLDD
jgi:hypothetical protein